jgi:predicted DNA-binding protein
MNVNERRYPILKHVRISPELDEKFQKVREAKNMRESELIREILEDYLQ